MILPRALAVFSCATWSLGIDVVVLVAAASGGSTGAAAAGSAAVPLIGASYTHYSNADCSLAGSGVIEFGRSAQTRIKRQLAAMRAAGVESLRTRPTHTSPRSPGCPRRGTSPAAPSRRRGSP